MKYVVVGITPQENHSEVLKIAAGCKGNAIGRKECDTLIEFDESKLPLFVVTLIINNDADLKLFALYEEKNSLSYLYTVGQTETFYFSEWRDDSTSSDGRRREWNRKVKQLSVVKDDKGVAEDI